MYGTATGFLLVPIRSVCVASWERLIGQCMMQVAGPDGPLVRSRGALLLRFCTCAPRGKSQHDAAAKVAKDLGLNSNAAMLS